MQLIIFATLLRVNLLYMVLKFIQKANYVIHKGEK